MKNFIFGSLCMGIFFYLLLCYISIYSISVRKNELSKACSCVVENALNEYLGSGVDSSEVQKYLTQELKLRLKSGTKVTVKIQKMDMRKGLLSVRVNSKFKLPNGYEKSIFEDKIAIVDWEDG